MFDQSGNLIRYWGGAGPGYQWPESEHGVFVDDDVLSGSPVTARRMASSSSSRWMAGSRVRSRQRRSPAHLAAPPPRAFRARLRTAPQALRGICRPEGRSRLAHTSRRRAGAFGEVLAGFDTRLDTPPSIKRRHPDSSLALGLVTDGPLGVNTSLISRIVCFVDFSCSEYVLTVSLITG